jgi:hypothetical protein
MKTMVMMACSTAGLDHEPQLSNSPSTMLMAAIISPPSPTGHLQSRKRAQRKLNNGDRVYLRNCRCNVEYSQSGASRIEHFVELCPTVQTTIKTIYYNSHSFQSVILGRYKARLPCSTKNGDQSLRVVAQLHLDLPQPQLKFVAGYSWERSSWEQEGMANHGFTTTPT